MSRTAFVDAGAAKAAELLAREGWEVVDLERTSLDAMAASPDLLVGEIRSWCAEKDLRRLTALHAMAPDLPMVVIAERLEDDAGHAVYETLVDVPIIRRGGEDSLLTLAVVAAA